MSSLDADGMKYIVMMNIKNAKDIAISEKEIFDKYLQDKASYFIICGMADSEEYALQESLKNLLEMGIFNISFSEKELCNFISKHGYKKSMKYCWIDENNEPHLLPRAEVISDFCEKYKLSSEAKEELEKLFSFEYEAELIAYNRNKNHEII